MSARWKNDGDFIVVTENGEERCLNRQEAIAYRGTLQWPDEYDAFEPYENRQLLAVDPEFAKAATAGIIQIGHALHGTRQ